MDNDQRPKRFHKSGHELLIVLKRNTYTMKNNTGTIVTSFCRTVYAVYTHVYHILK